MKISFILYSKCKFELQIPIQLKIFESASDLQTMSNILHMFCHIDLSVINLDIIVVGLVILNSYSLWIVG